MTRTNKDYQHCRFTYVVPEMTGNKPTQARPMLIQGILSPMLDGDFIVYERLGLMLPPELLRIIASLSPRHELFTLCSTSRSLHVAAFPFLYTELTVTCRHRVLRE